MRDAGFDFDDEIFGATTCREIRIEQVYEPKQCDSGCVHSNSGVILTVITDKVENVLLT